MTVSSTGAVAWNIHALGPVRSVTSSPGRDLAAVDAMLGLGTIPVVIASTRSEPAPTLIAEARDSVTNECLAGSAKLTPLGRLVRPLRGQAHGHRQDHGCHHNVPRSPYVWRNTNNSSRLVDDAAMSLYILRLFVEPHSPRLVVDATRKWYDSMVPALTIVGGGGLLVNVPNTAAGRLPAVVDKRRASHSERSTRLRHVDPDLADCWVSSQNCVTRGGVVSGAITIIILIVQNRGCSMPEQRGATKFQARNSEAFGAVDRERLRLTISQEMVSKRAAFLVMALRM
ncbi:predicted protein [Verticillium alfalfae VaMs.102]|uniref:Predicted protein n=1 Tax=Verticillium alfalfae (strain VaMs.102 / ATCC MYA-4576 / FGSC 10136) TaxID=526221 RepID=C9S696_VERA1|nr:predicted protein [Verticillium alfalfae VaMs.102]EEY14408.1 predicted protein [Verticillium alfalfae VaMs.102]